jgi:hypothetical protein
MIRKSVVEYNIYGTWYYGASMCRYNGNVINILEHIKAHIEYLQTNIP